MQADTTTDVRAAPIAADELRAWQQRSDGRGISRFAGHLLAIAVTGGAYGLALDRSPYSALIAFLAIAYGFTLVTMFAAMHESVHRTAFRSQGLNDAAGWIGGLLSFYNSTFYRPYHGWHHRYTQLPGKDPELEDTKPKNLADYFLQMSGLPWWWGKLKTHCTLALGRTSRFPFLNEKTGPEVVRSVRLQLACYAAAELASLALGRPYFLLFWLVPVAVGQPLLRVILLAEHTGCSNDDDALANTRTTHTNPLVRFFMWEMPYHAEHHRYPALPFFALRQAHTRLRPHLTHVARRGYLALHAEFLARLGKGSSLERPA